MPATVSLSVLRFFARVSALLSCDVCISSLAPISTRQYPWYQVGFILTIGVNSAYVLGYFGSIMVPLGWAAGASGLIFAAAISISLTLSLPVFMKMVVKGINDTEILRAIYTEIGELIAKAMEKVGKEGVITISNAKTLYNELEVVKGMKLDRGYVSSYFITNKKTQQCYCWIVLEQMVFYKCVIALQRNRHHPKGQSSNTDMLQQKSVNPKSTMV